MPDRCRPGSAAIASSTRRNRAARTSILAASKTSVRNSTTQAPIPAALPGLGEPFSELERQIPTSSLDISVQRRICTSPNAIAAVGSPRFSAKFCHPNATWNSG